MAKTEVIMAAITVTTIVIKEQIEDNKENKGYNHNNKIDNKEIDKNGQGSIKYKEGFRNYVSVIY